MIMNAFKWCFAQYLHPADHHPARNIKLTDNLEINYIFNKIKDIHKIEKKNFISISIFGYKNQVKYLIYVPKNALTKNMLIYY